MTALNPTEIPLGARRVGAGTQGLEIADLERTDRLTAIRNGLLATVHSWELVTAVDGPGTRMTVFFSGRPLRCQYCHNPDTWAAKDGQDITLGELLALMKRHRRVFHASGGGITLSGGEVLQQHKFAARLLHAVHGKGIHTAIDTSGFGGHLVPDEMLDDIDLVILDVKAGDEATHLRVTTRRLAPTIEFGDRVAAKGIEIWGRFVLVPGLTDDFDDVERVADIMTRWGSLTRVEVLPFHQMGADKWAALGLNYRLADTEPPSLELLDRVRAQFRARGLTTY